MNHGALLRQISGLEKQDVVQIGKDYSAEIGQPISVTVPANACHLFDQSTGARIAA